MMLAAVGSSADQSKRIVKSLSSCTLKVKADPAKSTR